MVLKDNTYGVSTDRETACGGEGKGGSGTEQEAQFGIHEYLGAHRGHIEILNKQVYNNGPAKERG